MFWLVFFILLAFTAGCMLGRLYKKQELQHEYQAQIDSLLAQNKRLDISLERCQYSCEEINSQLKSIQNAPTHTTTNIVATTAVIESASVNEQELHIDDADVDDDVVFQTNVGDNTNPYLDYVSETDELSYDVSDGLYISADDILTNEVAEQHQITEDAAMPETAEEKEIEEKLKEEC